MTSQLTFFLCSATETDFKSGDNVSNRASISNIYQVPKSLDPHHATREHPSRNHPCVTNACVSQTQSPWFVMQAFHLKSVNSIGATKSIVQLFPFIGLKEAKQ